MRIFLQLRSVLAVLLALAVAPAAWAAGQFFSAVDDLPLMPGLTEQPAESMVFDKPGGRIVEVVARGAVSITAVRDFYRATLPRLGWQTVGDDHWRRDDEELRLRLTGSGPVSLRFTMAPISGRRR